jgi:hypothetical protein
MFTRDIALEDCLLDLIDNSIDALVRSHNLDLSRIPFTDDAHARAPLPQVSLTISSRGITVEDNCGGITRAAAEEEVFNFGRSPSRARPRRPRLGAYGIGLKRAIFKIGSKLSMRSQTPSEGFSINVDLAKWATKDDSLDDWRFPMTFIPAARSLAVAGTKIRVTDLHEEVKMRLEDSTFFPLLRGQVARTYAWFLNRYVRVLINHETVEPFAIPLAESSEVKAGTDRYQDASVSVFLFAGLAERGPRGEWRSEAAGWYVTCNGRVVLIANKDDLTGWGGGALPTFQPKYRGFLGLAFFQSSDPLLLPWTTTKRGLNRESMVFQRARNKMRGLARPVLTFLDHMYPSETPEAPDERELARTVKTANLIELAARGRSTFTLHRRPEKPVKTTVRVQYDAEREELEQVRKHLKQPDMPANQIGRHTFDYFLTVEGLS